MVLIRELLGQDRRWAAHLCKINKDPFAGESGVTSTSGMRWHPNYVKL